MSTSYRSGTREWSVQRVYKREEDKLWTIYRG